MLKILEKPFGRTIGIAVVDTAKNLPALGFETDSPPKIYCRLPFGKFAVRVKSTDTFDLVVRLDNQLLLEKRFEAGTHTISRTGDGKPLFHAAPGSKPEFVVDTAGKSIQDEPAAPTTSAEEPMLLLDGIAFPSDQKPAAPTRLFPDSDPEPGSVLAETHGLLIVQVRFAHVQPDYGPVLPPDGFSTLRYQLNEPHAHARALACNFRKVVKPEAPPAGTPDILDPADANMPPVQLPPKRICCMACDRDQHQ